MFQPVIVRVGVVCAVFVSGCSTVDVASHRLVNALEPYQIDIVQGNFVSREQVAALQEGMPQLQVRHILGTPLLASIFHADRWDYVFTFKRQGIEPQSRRVTVFFKDGLLTRIDADDLPSEAEFVASIASDHKVGPVPILEAPPNTVATVTPSSTHASEASQVLPPLPASYPPLEAPDP